ncbi:putative aryl-alcohol dehydrogenase [Xylogone sp. PMI_703]|nr:putative aryl-alcohol dehydrogenase [Xylogone sp. PMI_703]
MINTPVLCDLSEFTDETTSFDYIIVGGGTSGLVLASRLTEYSNVRVGVIEAGKSRLGDHNVEGVGGISTILHNPEYDWIYKTVPQTSNNNKVHHVVRGKLLGGSSGVNFMTYITPSASDIDSWGETNKGWSWKDLKPYYRKHEAFHRHPSEKERPDHFVLNPSSHGDSGPIQVSFPPTTFPFEDSLIKAFDEISGLSRPKDPYDGDHLGFFEYLSTIDRHPGNVSRSYAATGHLAPALERSNLKVLTEATASRILLSKAEQPIARGVEFWHGNKLYRVFAKKEIILSTSTIQSPRLLELSGIGHKEVLQNAGVECLVPNLFVGENLQEHPMTVLTYELVGEENVTLDSLFQDPALFQKHLEKSMTTQDGFLAGNIGLTGFIPYASQVSSEVLKKTIASIENSLDTETSRYHVTRLDDPRSSNIQFIGVPATFNIKVGYNDQSKLIGVPYGHNGSYSILISAMYPVSRGSTHIQGSKMYGDQASPEIDLGLLTHPADVDIIAAGLMFADRVFTQSTHVSAKIGRRVSPPVDVDLTDFDQAKAFVRNQISIFNHNLGTCTMGKVVDERLRVKGVKGLRVVDASVIPFQLSGNIISTVYAVAERAADIIKEDHE